MQNGYCADDILYEFYWMETFYITWTNDDQVYGR